jgi:hypothetical protein
MRPSHLIATLLLLVFLLTSSALFAQTATGQVNGTIVDPTGAFVPNVKVTITNQGTKISRTTNSNASGYYLFINLQPGIYVLAAESQGFKRAETAPFELAVNQTVTQPVALAVGTASETVEVKAVAPLLQLSSSELGTVIPQRAVNDLPLNGRNFTQLLTLTPGATPVSTAQGSGISVQDAAISGIPGSSFSKPSVEGQPNRSTLYYLDGIINTDLRGPVYGVLPIVDTIDEFKVQSHNDKVEYGGAMGGVVSVVSKSGTSQFHGSAWEFVRNNAFDARNPFTDVSTDPVTKVTTTHGPAVLRQHEFGAAIGGPIIKNKTFFYAGYEGWRFIKPTQSQTYVPTVAEMGGDFTNTPNARQIFNPYSTVQVGPTTFTRTPFMCDASGNPLPVNSANVQTGVGTACNKLPAALISPVMQGYLKAFRLAPDAQVGSTVNFIDPRSQIDNADTWTVRVDHSFRASDSIFFRFTQMLVSDVNHVVGTIESQTSNYHANNFGGGWVHSFRSNLILDVSAGALRKPYVFNQANGTAQLSTMKQLGLNVDQFNGMVATLSSPWLTNEIGNRGNSIRSNPDWSAAANLDWLKGNHDFRFGGGYVWVARDQINTFQTFGFGSGITGSGSATNSNGLSLASALLGLPTSGSGELPTLGEVNFSLASWSLYGSDQWKILPSLTVNLGLRWDFLTQPTMRNDRLSNGLDLFNQHWIIGAASLPPACSQAGNSNGCIPDAFFTPCPSPNPCNSLFAQNGNVIAAGSKNFMSPPVHNNYGPRVGFAWQPLRKTVVRGGIGLFWDTLSARSQYAQNDIEGQRWPWVSGFTSTAPGSTLGPNNNNILPALFTPITTLAGGTTTTVPANPWNQNGNANQPNWQNPWSMQYNFEIQRELGPSTVVSAAYVGSRDGHLPYVGKANALPQPLNTISGTPCVTNGVVDKTDNCLRAVPWMSSGTTYNTSIGYGNYNSLQARFQRNFTSGLMTLVSYTWSKSLDNSDGFFGVENGAGQGGSAVQSFFDPTGNYGPSGYDIPHFLSWYTVYELPVGKGRRWLQSGPASWLLGNWQTNYIFQIRSGQPFNLNVGGDPAQISGNTAIGQVTGYSRPNQIADPFTPGPVAANPDELCHFTLSQTDNIPGPNFGKPGKAADTVHSAASWFNACAFTSPLGSFGDVGRNSLRSAHVTNLDLSLAKSIPLGEGKSLQLRFEAFNILNIQNYAAPNGTSIATNGIGGINSVNTVGAGQITSIVGNPRQMQFGARFTF